MNPFKSGPDDTPGRSSRLTLTFYVDNMISRPEGAVKMDVDLQ
jgi:hypothetical protein